VRDEGRIERKNIVVSVAVFGLHTLAIYIIALHISPWMINRLFHLAAIVNERIQTSPADWYLQHLPLVSAVAAVIAGYLVIRSMLSIARWAWAIPVSLLIFEMLRYQMHSSVIIGHSVSALDYFFGAQHSMPTILNPTASDPVRVLAQMTVTAPACAGVAYSLGALMAKRAELSKIASKLRNNADEL
jgi:hypothetical protein